MSNDTSLPRQALKTHSIARLRDPDIRDSLHNWLRAAHADTSDTEILHELKMPRPSARIDIAVVNGELCGFEIKSEVDSLARLERQQRAFSAVFDRVSIVTTDCHIPAAEKQIPKWWGIIRARRSNATISFKRERASKKNPTPNTTSLVHILSKKEIISLFDSTDRAVSPNKRREFLIDAALDCISDFSIREKVKAILKLRNRLTNRLHTEPNRYSLADSQVAYEDVC